MTECEAISRNAAEAWALRHGIEKEHLFEFLGQEGYKLKEESKHD